GAAEVLGIRAVPDPAARVGWVRERTGGRGADVAIEASGSPAAVPEGLEMVRDAGTYVVVGQYTDAGDATINPHAHLNRRHVTLRGCWGFEFTHLHRALQLMGRHARRVPWRALVTRECAREDPGGGIGDM